MTEAQAAAFIVFTAIFVITSVLAMLALGVGRLEGPIGLHRDGYPHGRSSPAWRHADISGRERNVPSGERWQLLLFADHSLAMFPSVIKAMRLLTSNVPELQVLVLCTRQPELTAAVLQDEGLVVSVVAVDQAFYRRHRVRVMPFATVLDPEGVVRANGLANSGDALLTIWRHSQLTDKDRRYLGPRTDLEPVAIDGRR